MLLYSTAALALGFLLDLALGDPPRWPHLIRGLGSLISWLEQRLYPLKNKARAGALLVLPVCLASLLLPAALFYLAFRLSPWLYLALEALLCWQLLAVKSLKRESLKVYQALIANDSGQARATLSMIVGRDTAALDTAGIIRATVETVAENTGDGVAAPLFYLALGSGPLGCLYKAANTMDSMIGYRNERYLAFGRWAARLDDGLNYLPSRLCALALLAAAWLSGLDAAQAWRIWRRDRRKHASPNSGQTEAVVAGALGLRLGGPASYGGIVSEKPTLGDDCRPIRPEDILAAHRLLYLTAWLLLLFTILFRGCLYAAL